MSDGEITMNKNTSLRRALGLVPADELADEINSYVKFQKGISIIVLDEAVVVERRDGICLLIEVPLNGTGYVTPSSRGDCANAFGYTVLNGRVKEIVEQFLSFDQLDFDLMKII